MSAILMSFLQMNHNRSALNPYIFGPVSVEKQRIGYISVIDLILRIAFTLAKALAKLQRNDNSW